MSSRALVTGRHAYLPRCSWTADTHPAGVTPDLLGRIRVHLAICLWQPLFGIAERITGAMPLGTFASLMAVLKTSRNPVVLGEAITQAMQTLVSATWCRSSSTASAGGRAPDRERGGRAVPGVVGRARRAAPVNAPVPVARSVPFPPFFCRWIEELANRGIVTGCGGGNYCPSDPVTREQMGVFIAVTFGLTLYGP